MYMFEGRLHIESTKIYNIVSGHVDIFELEHIKELRI